MATQHQIGIQRVFSLKEAVAAAGLTVDSWRSWQKRGLVPAGTLIATSGGKQQRRIFTHSEVEAARAAVDRMGRPTAEHTISREEGARMLGISIWRWEELGRAGLIPAGCWVPSPEASGRGGRRKLYTPDEVHKVREALAALRSRRPTIDGEEAITRKQAAAMIGIPQRQWYLWETKGWMPEGTWVPRIGGGGTMKVFTPAEITELKAAIARGEHPSCKEAPTREHTITREEAARAVGLSTGRWDQLGRLGLIPSGRLVRNRGGGRRRMYSLADVARAQEAIEGLRKDRRAKVNGQEAITLKEAAEMIGISRPLWYCWESKGWLPEGHQVPKLGSGGMMKVYLPAEIDALRAVIERGEHPGVKDRGTPEHTITRRKAAAMLGITISMWNQWEKDGLVPPGKKPPLSPSLGVNAGRHLWTPAQVDEVRRKAQELGVLNPAATPEHTLTREEAAELAGISIQMWTHWVRKGVISPGRWSPHGKGSGKGGLRRLHSPEEVQQARAALDEIGFGRAPNATDEHTISRREAARMLGVEPSAVHKWEKRGIMPIGAWRRSKKGPGLSKLYTAAEVEAARDALMREGVRCFARATPEHSITRQQAARIIGVPWSTWSHWEGQGRTPIGAWAPAAAGRGRCKLYTRQELDAFAEELRTQHLPYPDPDRPGCYRVPIRSWKRRMEAIIDAEDLPLIEGKNWNYSERNDECDTRGVVILSTTSARAASLKQLITGRRGRRWRIRHANGNFLDCRRTNLIVLDIAEQTYGNRKMRTRAGKELTSKYKGVCWCEARGKWLAQIRKDGGHRHLGRFDDEIDAAEAYDKAAQELFGEFARLNFPSSAEGAARRLAAA